jgi:hypothetical protein
MGGGKDRDLIDKQHVLISNLIKKQSERDFPRGSMTYALIDGTKCQSSEQEKFVSFTVNVNLGKLNEANDIATMIILPSNVEPSVLSRSRRQEMMQKISLQEKRRDQPTTKRRFTLSQVWNDVYKRRRLLHGLPAGTR